jgi:ornithine cyclodeaminase/alanine dehydrogenase-like protein (mu-crystallin family)
MTVFLSNDDVTGLITAEEVIDILELTYLQVAERQAVCRPRFDMQIPTSDPKRIFQWGTMEGGSTAGYFAIRMKSDVLYEREYNGASTQEQYCVEPGKFCGLIFLLRVNNGEPLALINDGVIQHLRVGADGAIGVKHMARKDAAVVGMLGSGGMARSHMETLMIVRPGLKRLQVYSPTPANREKFGQDVRDKYGIEVVVCDNPRDVYRGADIVAALTDSAVTVLNGDWIEKGTHILSVGGGSGRPDDATLQKVDRYMRFGRAPAPFGLPEMQIDDEFIAYRADPEGCTSFTMKRSGKRGHGILLPDRMVTLEQAIQDPRKARGSDDEITYSERGNLQGSQFFPLAGMAYERAVALGRGFEIPTRMFLQDIRN